jgi:hypothetical protein
VAGIAIFGIPELRALTEIDAVVLRPGVDEWERKRKQPRNLAAFFGQVKLRKTDNWRDSGGIQVGALPVCPFARLPVTTSTSICLLTG